ncbi:MAG: ATP-binding cassette domain-containing protein, partial [Myxococcota bacterium]
FGQRWSASEARDRAIASLYAIGIAHLADQRAATLSVGEANRVGLARALAKEPQLLLADEPTASVDGPTAAALRHQLLLARDEGCSVVLTTHDPALARACDRRFELVRPGQLVEVE